MPRGQAHLSSDSDSTTGEERGGVHSPVKLVLKHLEALRRALLLEPPVYGRPGGTGQWIRRGLGDVSLENVPLQHSGSKSCCPAAYIADAMAGCCTHERRGHALRRIPDGSGGSHAPAIPQTRHPTLGGGLGGRASRIPNPRCVGRASYARHRPSHDHDVRAHVACSRHQLRRQL